MRLIIAGSRELVVKRRDYDEEPLFDLIDSSLRFFSEHVETVLCGMAPGMDLAGRAWATHHHRRVEEFPADWEAHRKAAGPIRNQAMVDAADALLVVRYQHSRGSADVLSKARGAGLEVVDVVLPWRVR